MTIVAHHHPFVIGADTHARSHAISILASPTGELVDEAQFPATGAGLARAIAWAARRTGGDLAALWVVEGTGTYGARLTRTAADGGYTVVEAARMNARAHRGVGKSDPLDARRIAQAVLPLEVTELRTPRSDDGERAAVRVLLASRDHMSNRTHRNDQRPDFAAARQRPRNRRPTPAHRRTDHHDRRMAHPQRRTHPCHRPLGSHPARQTRVYPR